MQVLMQGHCHQLCVALPCKGFHDNFLLDNLLCSCAIRSLKLFQTYGHPNGERSMISEPAVGSLEATIVTSFNLISRIRSKLSDYSDLHENKVLS